MRYLFMSFRYLDGMNNSIDRAAQEGWLVHSISAIFNPLSGQIEYLVCLEKERAEAGT